MSRTAKYDIEIRKLVAERFSGRQIGDRLGLTKNQISGICWRLGIHLCSTNTPFIKETRQIGEAPKFSEIKPRPDFRDVAPTFPVYSPHPISGCRYGVGDPQSPDFKFCEKQTVEQLSYCVEHARLCFVKIKHHASIPEALRGVPSVERVKTA